MSAKPVINAFDNFEQIKVHKYLNSQLVKAVLIRLHYSFECCIATHKFVGYSLRTDDPPTLIIAPDSFLILDMLDPHLPIKPPTNVSETIISKVT